MEVLESAHWGRLYPNSKVEQFEQIFAKYQDARYGVAVANGTVSLELCLKAGGIAPLLNEASVRMDRAKT